MRGHFPNPIQFIIDYISLWSENQIDKPSCATLYQDYLSHGVEVMEKNYLLVMFLGKKISQIDIDRTRSRDGGVKVYQYIFNRSKIISKLHEKRIDIEEFSDKSYPPTRKIEATSSNTDHIEKGKNTSTPPVTKMTQDLFDSIIDQPEYSVASSSNSTNISSPKIIHVEPIDHKSKSAKISPNLPINNEPKTSNEVETESRISDSSFQQISYPLGYQTREQQEIRLRQKAIELGEDPDKFITITKKDKLDSIAFCDRMQTDARLCGYAKEAEEDPKNIWT
ncbi:hypothetical protein C2G38_2185149 [Gigaspora rosea]|uniref:Uncharacterized protein n=1 Tax=Gigaspora rosea TaxID=44941 RepID=A0A397V8M2_9GLOM|nr:hypothetical protein C2G38_2185149 [Gigaspora rosea]